MDNQTNDHKWVPWTEHRNPCVKPVGCGPITHSSSNPRGEVRNNFAEEPITAAVKLEETLTDGLEQCNGYMKMNTQRDWNKCLPETQLHRSCSWRLRDIGLGNSGLSDENRPRDFRKRVLTEVKSTTQLQVHDWSNMSLGRHI